MLNHAIPTSDKIHKVINSIGHQCYMCYQLIETLQYLLLQWPLIKLVWWNSPWKIKIEAFGDFAVEDWISLILGINNNMPLDCREKSKIKQFFVSLLS